jgi:hypothetical protein
MSFADGYITGPNGGPGKGLGDGGERLHYYLEHLGVRQSPLATFIDGVCGEPGARRPVCPRSR